MSVLQIRIYPDPVLKKQAESVQQVDESIKQLADDMLETLYESPGGVGLAAPQVGESVRLIVIDVSHRLEEEDAPVVLINPEIVESEGEVIWEEGCLSFPGYTADIKRAEKVKVTALDLAGEQVEYDVDDFMAIVFQHEIDHLSGTLILDHVSPLKREIYRRKLKKAAKEKKNNN